jgi:hypothetical protein
MAEGKQIMIRRSQQGTQTATCAHAVWFRDLMLSHPAISVVRGVQCGVHAVQVACLADGEAHLALEKDDPFALQTKPHGHGDAHGGLPFARMLTVDVQPALWD